MRNLDDRVEYLPRQGKAEQIEDQQTDKKYGNVFIVEDIVFQGEEKEADEGDQKEKAEDDGQAVVKTGAFNG